MRRLFRLLRGTILVAVIVVAGVFAFVFFSPRPQLSIDPTTLAGDGSELNYCDLPELSSDGKVALDIPKGNTPDCAYQHFPLPVLRECTEPLVEGAADIRGLWQGVSGKVGHVERIEQCGARVVVTTSGIIHDLGPNLTGGYNSNDTEGTVLFTIGDREFCPRTSAGALWEDGILNFRVLGWGPIVVKRYLQNDNLIWEYADGSVTRLKRICHLPPAHKIPQPRGPRYQLW